MNFLARMTAGVAAMLAVSSCGHEERAADQQGVSYASRDPGSGAMPTNDVSFQLLALDGPTRLEWLQMMVSRSGKQCNIVTSGVLIGGLDGTDEWRVKCADSGIWAMWLKADAMEVARCPTANCT